MGRRLKLRLRLGFSAVLYAVGSPVCMLLLIVTGIIAEMVSVPLVMVVMLCNPFGAGLAIRDWRDLMNRFWREVLWR